MDLRGARLLLLLLLVAASPPHEVHKGWPADPARWTRLRCDLSGIIVPSIAPFGKTDNDFTIIYPLYPPAVRADIRAAHKARGYTHFVLDPAPWYKDIYPSGDFYGRPGEMKSAIRELLDDDLLPVIMFDPGGNHEWTAERAVAEMRRKLAPWLADDELLSLIKVASLGWEVDDHLSPPAIEATARYLRSVLKPDTRLFIHLGPGRKSGAARGETDAEWWARMANDNVLDGSFFNLPGGDQTISVFKAALAEMAAGFSGRIQGWPSRRRDGRPLRLIAFEYSAYFDHKKPQWTEEWARSLGAAVLEVPGVWGFCDGGPAPGAPGGMD